MAKAWSIDPSQFAEQVETDVGKWHRIISMALLTEIVFRSPVDKGTFRGSHVVSVGAPDYSLTVETDKTGTKTIQQGQAVIAKSQPFSVLYIQTNLPYAEPLENGHSQQAPAGVYGVSFHGVTQAYK